MGMGKTSSALTLLDALEEVERGPALVLAPLRVAKSTWPREAEKWEHLRGVRISPVVGSEDARITAIRRDANVYTMNYENLPWLVEYLERVKKPWPFTKVIADEATRLKNFRLRNGGQRAKVLARVAHQFVKHWINLTGTPAPNGLKDLWGQTWFLDAGARLGRTYDAFKQRWFQRSWDGFGLDPLQFADQQIHDKLRDICVTLDPADYFDIEKPLVRPVYVELPPRARAKYREMEKEMFTQIERDDIEAFNAAARTMKCLQLASGTVWVDTESKRWAELHDVKLQALESIVEEAGGMPLLVRYHWVPSRERILKAFPGARLLGTDPKTIDDFGAGKIPMLVLHAASAGHGVDGLQDGTNILADFDHWWDLEQYDQILERIGPVRQVQSGHRRPVFRYPIIARDTVDELVLARTETKRAVQDLLLEAMKRRGK
jgi:SNF2 family DNA or RNA helicase